MTRKYNLSGGYKEATTNGTQNAFIKTIPGGGNGNFSFSVGNRGYNVAVYEDPSRLGGYLVDGSLEAVRAFLNVSNEKQAWETYYFRKTNGSYN